MSRSAALTIAGAWLLLLLQDRGLFLPEFCAMTVLTPAAALASLELVLALNPPEKLAAGWAVMLAAMMTPLMLVPLRHIRDTSLPRRRLELMTLFIGTYVATWMAAGAVLLTFVLLLRLAVPWPWMVLSLALLMTFAWNASPARQRCLNLRHTQPPLPAFGASASVAALEFGVAQGFWCVGACWGLMMLPLVVPHGHLPAMAVVALWQVAEHIEPPEPPSWKWRWPRRAVRMIAWRVRNRWLAPTPSRPSNPAR
jgi:predicted metal-binding membrane protein